PTLRVGTDLRPLCGRVRQRRGASAADVSTRSRPADPLRACPGGAPNETQEREAQAYFESLTSNSASITSSSPPPPDGPPRAPPLGPGAAPAPDLAPAS